MAIAKNWVLQGDTLVANGHFEEALEKYQAALNFDPNYFTAAVKKTNLLTKINNKEYKSEISISAYTQLREEKKLLSRNPDKWIYRGLCFPNGRFSIETFNEKNAFNWFNYGIDFLAAGEYIQAEQKFDRCIYIQPNYSNAWFAKGYCLENKSQHENAKLAYVKGIESCNTGDFFYDDEPVDWNNKGYALGVIGKYDDAIATLDNAFSDSNLFYSQFNFIKEITLLNKIYSFNQLCNFNKVLQLCDEILSLNPNSRSALRIRELTLMKENGSSKRKWWQI